MATRLGHFLYWAAVTVALLLGAAGAWCLQGNEEGVAAGIFLIVIAALAYLFGCGLRYVLSGS